MIYRCEVRDSRGRRVGAGENWNIADIRNGAEVKAILIAICRRNGAQPTGCTMRVWTQDRRPQLVQEVTA